MPHITLDQAQAAKRVVLERFDKLDQITGVGITRVAGEYAVKVNLSEPVEPGIEIPADVDGVKVRVEVTGTIRVR